LQVPKIANSPRTERVESNSRKVFASIFHLIHEFSVELSQWGVDSDSNGRHRAETNMLE